MVWLLNHQECDEPMIFMWSLLDLVPLLSYESVCWLPRKEKLEGSFFIFSCKIGFWAFCPYLIRQIERKGNQGNENETPHTVWTPGNQSCNQYPVCLMPTLKPGLYFCVDPCSVWCTTSYLCNTSLKPMRAACPVWSFGCLFLVLLHFLLAFSPWFWVHYVGFKLILVVVYHIVTVTKKCSDSGSAINTGSTVHLNGPITVKLHIRLLDSTAV